ncbi:hypothetical protein ABDK56_00630 [Sphingomonas sp. ASV193]|uniref:hypothetical protein n=1 Tax=Sphingomonas sp. ASV193 TaxID=3144405 RepID=UPI0032E898FC
MIDLGPPSRLAGASRPAALGLVAAIAALLLVALWPSATPPAAPKLRTKASQQSDLALYRTIIARMRAGEGYYPAAADELRRDGYPLKPVFTVRLPTLATLYARLGEPMMIAIEALVALAALLVWWRRLEPWPLWLKAFGVVLFAGGTGGLVEPVTGLFHESWAALLMALALGLWRPRRAWPAILIAGAALMIRETVLPFVLMMSLLAAVEKRWREAAGWLVPVALFALYLGWHAGQVAAVVRPGDPASPGWQALLGLRFALRALGSVNALILAPYAVAAVVLLLSIVGWCSLDRPWGLRAAGLLVGYTAMVGLFARADTFYWALLAAPLSLVGVTFVPAAVRDLARALRPVAVSPA